MSFCESSTNEETDKLTYKILSYIQSDETCSTAQVKNLRKSQLSLIDMGVM